MLTSPSRSTTNRSAIGAGVCAAPAVVIKAQPAALTAVPFISVRRSNAPVPVVMPVPLPLEVCIRRLLHAQPGLRQVRREVEPDNRQRYRRAGKEPNPPRREKHLLPFPHEAAEGDRFNREP